MADSDEVTLNAFGKSVSIKGLGTIIVLIVLTFSSGLSYMLYDLSHSATLAMKEAAVVNQVATEAHLKLIQIAATLRQDHAEIIEGVKRVDSSLKTQNWILLADPVERSDIKRRLAMPKELHELGVRER
jgi:hypothetical protein